MYQETRNPGNGFAGKQKTIFSCLLAFLISFAPSRVLAGDAVAAGYNQDGIWTSVTYYASSNPKGGKDYKSEVEAREAARRDLQKRDVLKPARIEIISSSDATRFVAVGGGPDNSRKDVNEVGRGKTLKEANNKPIERRN